MIGKHELKKRAGRKQSTAARYRRTTFEALERREVLSAPTLAAIDDVTLNSGAPLHIALDGFDADGDTLTYSVEISGANAGDVTSFIPEGNRSMRITVADYGEMVFELFEGLVQGGKTLILVTHDKDLSARTERVIHLLDGRVRDDVRNGNSKG